MEGDLVIPPRLAGTVVSWEGEAGREWLDDLPLLVDEVAAIWDLEVGPPFQPGGQISWVAPACRRHDDVDIVLKVQLPHPESAPEATGLQAWDGDGAVRLLAHDRLRSALLLERCTPGHGLVDLGGSDDAVVIGAELGARLHAAAIPEGLPTLASVLDAWADELEERLVLPYVDPGLERLALDTMRMRPRACSHEVLLHGDLNPTNVLSAARAPWLAIDPKPMVGDPAYDGPRLVTQPDPQITSDAPATLARRLDLVSDVMGIDRDALVAWSLVDSVEIGASARSHGDTVAAAERSSLVELLAIHL